MSLPLVCVPLTLAAISLFPAVPGRVDPEKQAVIRKGDYEGLWTGTKTKFSILEVHGNNTFDGVAELTEGRYAGIKFGFHGRVGRDGSMIVTRYVAGDSQIARVGPPRLAEGHFVWAGETTGVGLPEVGSWPFVLRIPKP